MLGGEEPEDADLVDERQLPHGRRDVGRVGGGDDVGETVVAPATQQLLDGFGEPFRLVHYGIRCADRGQTTMPCISTRSMNPGP